MKSRLSSILFLPAGLLFLILNILIWIYGLIVDISHGMDIILTVPILVAGVFLVAKYYKTSWAPETIKAQKWKFILSLLLVNYSILYPIYIISEMIYSEAIDFLSVPGLILPILLCLFIIGFILAWNYEFHAAIVFLLWYGLTLFGQLRYPQLLDRGPYILIGLTILLQGILYMVYHFKIKSQS